MELLQTMRDWAVTPLLNRKVWLLIQHYDFGMNVMGIYTSRREAMRMARREIADSNTEVQVVHAKDLHCFEWFMDETTYFLDSREDACPGCAFGLITHFPYISVISDDGSELAKQVRLTVEYP